MPVSNSPVNVFVGTVHLTPGQHGLIVEGQYTSNNDYTDNSCGFTSATLTPVTSETYAQWASQYFTPSQQANAAISGPEAFSQPDAVSNLLKYLFDIDPSRPMTSSDRTALPTAGTVTTGGMQYLTLTYRRFALATGLTSMVQTSADLTTWTTSANSITVQTGTDSVTGDPLMQVQVPFSGSREFIRLQVTAP